MDLGFVTSLFLYLVAGLGEVFVIICGAWYKMYSGLSQAPINAWFKSRLRHHMCTVQKLHINEKLLNNRIRLIHSLSHKIVFVYNVHRLCYQR